MFYCCGLVDGYIHSRSGNRIYYIGGGSRNVLYLVFSRYVFVREGMVIFEGCKAIFVLLCFVGVNVFSASSAGGVVLLRFPCFLRT